MFTAALRERGWVEGENLTLTLRSTEGRSDRAAELAAEIVGQSPDAIVTFNYPNTKAVADRTAAIPIVMFGVPSPVGLGLVASLAHPGGNITGLSSQTEDTLAKDLQLLEEAKPGIRHIAVITYGVEPYWKLASDGYTAAAQSTGLALEAIPVKAQGDLGPALAQVATGKPDALVVSSIPLFATHSLEIATFAIEHRLPTFTFQTQMARDGLLMSYESDLPEMYRTDADVVDKVLRGAKPADIPIEQPTRFRLTINLRTARAIGLEIPPSLLTRADAVIE